MQDDTHKDTFDIRTADEAALRDYSVPSVKTDGELTALIDALITRPHEYGTAVYAMSISAVAAFNYVAHKLGVTGFQAGCADLDVLRRTRHMEHGFTVLNYRNLLYPQYLDDFNKTADDYIAENKDALAKAARDLLRDRAQAHPDICAHWEKLAAMGGVEEST